MASQLESVNVEKILEQFDTESNYRKLAGRAGLAISLIAMAMSVFHFYTAGFGQLVAMKQRAIHLTFVLILAFLLWPAAKRLSRKRLPCYDVGLALAGLGVGLYSLLNYESLIYRAGLPTTLDLVVGIIAILLVLEVTRRTVGPELPIVAIIFLAYAYFGPYLPSILNHRGFSLNRIVEHTYLTTEGIFGTPIMVSSTFVFLFILYGAFLEKTGVGQFFIDLAFAATGHMKGGPAKTAVLASGLMGSISGSSVANTVTTGAFTIPAMKKVGYSPEFAGAVEAAASTGGQIMPPVMGAAAFIMSEMTGINYFQIIVAATIPAILYYLAVGTMVHLEAVKTGLVGMPKEQLPKARDTMKRGWHLMIPLIAIIYFLVVMKVTPFKAAYWSIMIAVLVAMLKKETRIGIKAILSALEDGARMAVGVASACACAGIVVGVVTLTGLGMKFASLIIAVAGGNLILTLFFTMIASLILGMGLPTTAKYIVLATMAAPALVQLGVPLIAAHLFILYFGVIADITPPVALAAYAGAGIAGGNAMKTGMIALKLASAGFLIPYIFALSPGLILVNVTWYQALHTFITALIGIVALAAGVQGWFFSKTLLHERALLFVSAFALIVPGVVTDSIGLGALALVYVLQKARLKKATAPTTLLNG
ncbi:MAG: TRAP transporter 4TM/12TM fusion protein [Bacillota bacterium]|nr:MAG: TRAP transporter 4TM/12TM fusion protein [Bacillota bacterium]MBS3949951.1 TRAP transporter permease [Peptococcaceae bacterium]